MSNLYELAFQQVIQDIKNLMTKHVDLDWTCACQAVALERGFDEQTLIEDMKEYFE